MLGNAAGLGLLAGLAALPMLPEAAAQGETAEPFDAGTVRRLARELAQKAYAAPDEALPERLDRLSYDQYRDIRFVPDRSLWRGTGLPFEMQLLHRGFLFRPRVELFVVADGRARKLAYQPELFSFGERVKRPAIEQDLGFSGFRLHHPLNRPDYYDEVAVFQGASYFRAVGRGHVYGLSARGLSLNTGDGAGEEFPFFRSFWIERPRPGTSSIVVHALLDSPSATAAYRFTIRPGDTTVMDVEMAIYPRADIAQAGIATATSMFLFASNDRRGVDDFRPAVHDSDGLLMLNGRGERLWRPLSNPDRLQISVFSDVDPGGFGLMQRQRSFFDYRDLEARYELRPSLWVEPIGDWGEGAVHLLEIPTDREINDNVVAFWRPAAPLRKGAEHIFTYRLHWTWTAPVAQASAWVSDTRVGATDDGQGRLFVLDFVGERLADLPQDALKATVSGSAGKLAHVVLQPNPEIEGLRLAFELRPERAEVVDLRATLRRGEDAFSETWTYRWTP